MPIAIKRIYEPPAEDDGMRVLVDRLWPRGITRYDAAIALWMKDVAPSPDLRRWFGHDAARWTEFRRRYRAELATNPAAVELALLVRGRHVTLVYGARDEEHNNAVVLATFLARHAPARARRA